MSAAAQGDLRIGATGDLVTARKTVRSVAEALGFGLTDVTRLVTVASELTRNAFQYAGSGVLHWQALDVSGRVGLELVVTDQGPGMADVTQALLGGYRSGQGLGLGLSGTKRLMDEFEIQSTLGQGTRVMVRKWRQR